MGKLEETILEILKLQLLHLRTDRYVALIGEDEHKELTEKVERLIQDWTDGRVDEGTAD